MTTSLGEEGAGLCASCAFVCLLCTFVSSSRGRGLAVVCDCGTPWTFLLTILEIVSIVIGPICEPLYVIFILNHFILTLIQCKR